MAYLRHDEMPQPNVMTRPCCYNCVHVSPDCSVLDRRTWCRKHRRYTVPGWVCSDHTSPTDQQSLEPVGSDTQATLTPSLAVGDIESRRREEAEP